VLHVVAVEPGTSLALAFDSMRLTARVAEEDGQGVFTLVHSGFTAGDPLLESCRSGWAMSLGLLKLYLEQYDGLDRQELLLLEPCEAPQETVYPWLADPKLRRRWLGVDDPPREALVDTGSEVLMRWDAVGGALELKQFSWGAGRYLCLRCSSWSRDYDLSYQRTALAECLRKLADQTR
jgi:hypothetical protein